MIFATALVALGLAVGGGTAGQQKRELEAKLYGPSGDVVKTFEDDAVIDQVPASADEKLEVTSSTHSLATGLVNEGTIDVKNTAVLKASSSTENSCAESPCPDGFFCDASDVCTPCLSCVGGPVAADVLHRLNGLAAGTYKEGQVFSQATTNAVGTVTATTSETATSVAIKTTTGAFDTFNVITVTKGDAADLAGLPADSDASTGGHQVAAPTSIVGELIAMNRGDVGGRLTPPHTLDAFVSLGAAAFGKHEANLSSGSGILLLPEHRLAMCLLPKNGCTTLKWVAMVLLGHSPSSVCGCKSSK